jgi:hypothetical protein
MLGRSDSGSKFSDPFAAEWTMPVSRASAAPPPARPSSPQRLAFSRTFSPLVAGGLAAVVALALGAICWGFTVDDALITCRYAHHLATGRGYVMNPGGPSTDGVTPLGYAQLLSLFASAGTESTLTAAKLLGLALHSAGAAALAYAIARMEGGLAKWAGLVGYFAALPVSAYAVSGLETGFVEGLVAIGLSLRVVGRFDKSGVLLLAIAAGLRPELLPMVVVLSLPRGVRDDDARFGLAAFGRLALAGLPFVAAAVTRAVVFGRPAPLSSLAKRPDLALGFNYAIASALLTGFIAIVAPFAWKGADRFTRWLAIAPLAHLAAVTFAGGDWMPISRLVVPALPVVALATARLAATSSPVWVSGRLVLALAGEIFVWFNLSQKIMHVAPDRQALIEQLRAPLADGHVIATLDIGFVGAAAPHATIVDLAGVTDPEIAILPGSHTEKQIPDGLLKSRNVDMFVLGLKDEGALAEPWERSPFARGVERWVASEPGMAPQFEPVFVTTGRLKYVVIVRRAR